jgi:hypothetical protein
MNRQKEPDIAVDVAIQHLLEKFPEQRFYADYFDYYAWPQTFGNTGGPFCKPGGVYGQAMTRFTIEAWVEGAYAVIFCNGRVVKVTNQWTGYL